MSSFHCLLPIHLYFLNLYNKPTLQSVTFTIKKRSLVFKVYIVFLASRKAHNRPLRGSSLNFCCYQPIDCSSCFPETRCHYCFLILLLCFLVWGFAPSTTLNCSEDDVYLPSEILLQEYIMRDYGFVYKGHERFVTSWPWNYGQVTLLPNVGLGWAP